MRLRIIIYLAVIFASVPVSCLRVETYSEIPEIHYKNFELSLARDTLLNNLFYKGVLTFSLIDGDGDIGSYQEGQSYRTDTNYIVEYDYDLYLTRFNKIDGKYEIDTANSNNTYLPLIVKEGQNKTLFGEIIVELDFYKIDYDTIQFEYFIVDRKENKSNADITPDLALTEIPDTQK